MVSYTAEISKPSVKVQIINTVGFAGRAVSLASVHTASVAFVVQKQP